MPNTEEFRRRAKEQGFSDEQIEAYLANARREAPSAEPAAAAEPAQESAAPSAPAESAVPSAPAEPVAGSLETGTPVEQPEPPTGPAVQTELPVTEDNPVSDAARGENRYHNYEPSENRAPDTGDSRPENRWAGRTQRMREEYSPESVSMSETQRQAALDSGFSEAQIAQYEAGQSDELNYGLLDSGSFARPNSQFAHTPEFGISTDESQDGLLPPDRVRSLAQEIGVDPRTQTGINAVYSKAQRDNRQRTETALVRDLRTINSVDRPYQWLKSQFGGAAEQEYESIRAENISDILRMANDRGVQLEVHDGEFFSRTEDGQLMKVEPGFFESMGAAKYETAGGIGGGIAGWAAGSALARNLNATGPWGRAITMGIAGGAALIGHVGGNQMDYLEAAIQTQEKWDAEVSMEKAVGSAQVGVLYEVAGLGAGKVASMGASNYRAVINAFNKWREKDSAGAIGYLRQSVGYITEEQGKEVLSRWEALNETNLPRMGGTNREMTAIALTQPGAENMVRKAASMNPSVGPAVAVEPARRARDLLGAIDNISDPNVAGRILDDLDGYVRDVKVQYDQVRYMGNELVPEGYAFQFNPITLKPLIEHQLNSLANPAQVNGLMNMLNKIDDYNTVGRSFDDLIELRQTMNASKYSRAFATRNNQRAVQSAIDEIDTEIESIMRNTEGGTEWLEDWSRARGDYAQMKTVQDNVFYKQLQRASHANTNERVASSLLAYQRGYADDYEQVMKRLAPATRVSVEGEILDRLTSKFTSGQEGQFQAINFTGLNKELSQMNMQTPDAQRIQQVVADLSEVYMNDQNLVQIANHVGMNFEQGIATSIKGKAKVAAVNRTWRFLRALTPGSEGDSMSLSIRLSKLLKDPLDAKTVGNLLEDRRLDGELKAALTRLQSETARELSEGATPPARMYSDASGKTFLEDGPGRRVLEDKIMPHRIVGTGDAKEILGVDEVNYVNMTRANRLKLIDRGFQAIGFENGQVLRLEQ